jgi:SAM-dependent methyltransferase
MPINSNLKIPSLKELYSRPYDERMTEWRRIGAVDKAKNIISILRSCGTEQSIGDVLEVGCGTGAVLREISGQINCRRFVGIEIGELRPKQAQAALAEGLMQIHGYDGTHIPYANSSFDLVYATHVLEHVVDERTFLHELRRVARKFVYVEVPCELHLRTTFSRLQDSLNIGHVNAYTLESFVLRLETSGLRVKELRLVDTSYTTKAFGRSAWKAMVSHALRRGALFLNEMAASRLFTYHAGALCEAAEKLDIG